MVSNTQTDSIVHAQRYHKLNPKLNRQKETNVMKKDRLLLPWRLGSIKDFHSSTVMPLRQQLVASATVVLGVLQRRNHVRDTSQTETEAKKCSPPTVWFS